MFTALSRSCNTVVVPSASSSWKELVTTSKYSATISQLPEAMVSFADAPINSFATLVMCCPRTPKSSADRSGPFWGVCSSKTDRAARKVDGLCAVVSEGALATSSKTVMLR